MPTPKNELESIDSEEARIRLERQEMDVDSMGEERAMNIIKERVQEALDEEKEGAQTFEEFDRIFLELGPQLLSAAETLKALPAFQDIRCKGSDITPKSLEGDTFVQVDANLCRRLTDAYRDGDKQALRDIPKSRGNAEDYVDSLIRDELIEPGDREEKIRKLERKKESALNSLTGGEYKISRLSPFGNETTGYHVYWLQDLIRRIKDPEISGKLKKLMFFIQRKQRAVKRKINLSPRYQEAVSSDKPISFKDLEDIRLLYYEMEIEYSGEVVAIGERLEKLFWMLDKFYEKIKE